MSEVNTIKICLSKQIEELEMLSSIYCNEREFKVEDNLLVSQIQKFIDGIGSSPSKLISYSVCLQYSDENPSIEVNVELPQTYPQLETPLISIRSPLVDRHNDFLLRQRIDEFVASLDKSDAYIYEVLCWIKENIQDYVHSNENASNSVGNNNPVTMERLWIYSHHIYNKSKRLKILQTARDCRLTGFSRPGKPGIICVEGPQLQTQDFWRQIKALTWQKITLKREEQHKQSADAAAACNFRRFNDFAELYIMHTEDGEECPMTMKNFVKYLGDHNSGYMVQELFGFHDK